MLKKKGNFTLEDEAFDDEHEDAVDKSSKESLFDPDVKVLGIFAFLDFLSILSNCNSFSMVVSNKVFRHFFPKNKKVYIFIVWFHSFILIQYLIR